MSSRVKSRLAPHPRRGFTIVEMLVTIVVVLFVLLTVVQLFDWVGTRVAQGRALIEMSGALRGAARRLELDLQTCTAPVRPWLDPGAGEGYFEIYEGAMHDLSEYWRAVAAGAIPESIDGDVDDILMFTSRNRDEPFAGHRKYFPLDFNNAFQAEELRGSITSDVAEIVWWNQFDDVNKNGNFERHELTLRRRALVVRPDLNNVHGIMTRLIGSNLADLQMKIANFMHNNDISVRMEIADPVNFICNVVANSLSDLTRRENRYAHWRVMTVLPNLQYASMPWPFPIDAADDFRSDHDFANYNASPTSLRRLAMARSLPTFVGEDVSRYGEDVILGGVLAFDVRVFDPEAAIFNIAAAPAGSTDAMNRAVAPGDAGWGDAVWQFINNPLSAAAPIGKGAFVDLGYLPRHHINKNNVGSHFSDVPDERSGLLHWVNNVTANDSQTFRMFLPRSTAFDNNLPVALYNGAGLYDKRFGMPRVYDTWPNVYERDGIQQQAGRAIIPANTTIDPATDGFDNDGINGTDDDGERETAPPYAFKLRGIQVTIRAYEHDTRQIRQTAVSSSFVPE